MLPICNPYGNCINQVAIETDVLITPPPIETTFKLNVPPKQSTWEQGILSEIRRELPIIWDNSSVRSEQSNSVDRQQWRSLCNEGKLGCLAIATMAIANTPPLVLPD